nr:hypothetical protein CFP56_30811 [Quercus suber]
MFGSRRTHCSWPAMLIGDPPANIMDAIMINRAAIAPVNRINVSLNAQHCVGGMSPCRRLLIDDPRDVIEGQVKRSTWAILRPRARQREDVLVRSGTLSPALGVQRRGL